MHLLIINFELRDLSHEDFKGIAQEVAPAFAAIPGLVSKTFLSNKKTNTYGGMYVFENEQAVRDYQASELYAGLIGQTNTL
jgi:hypothetical protein